MAQKHLSKARFPSQKAIGLEQNPLRLEKRLRCAGWYSSVYQQRPNSMIRAYSI